MIEPPDAAGSRKARLMAWLESHGRLDVLEAAGRLGVAPETVRRDLRALEAAGRLVRVHGGAVLPAGEPAVPVTALPAPEDPGDRALAQALCPEIPRTGTVLMGAGRLTSALTHVMVTTPPTATGLTVITNALDVAVHLARVPTVSVYNIGGTVARQTRAQEGDWAVEELARFRVDLALVCPAGLTVEYGLSHRTPAAAAVAQAMVDCAERTIALCSAPTVGRSALVRFAAVESVESVWVSGGLTAAQVRAFRARGVALRIFDQAEREGDRSAGRQPASI